MINPKIDKDIVKNYDVDTVFDNKVVNKLELQKEVGLPENQDVALIGIVTRLTKQKGLDLIINQFNEMCNRNVQIVILGAGDQIYEDALKVIASQYPDKVSLNLKYDFGLSCRIYAGCDMFLMPSLFEPCGLSQMMALRYGTIPIVRQTGGLKDSVEPYNEYANRGTGFGFMNYNAHEMMRIIDYALDVYDNHRDSWRQMITRAMNSKLDWDESANHYLKVFNSLIG